MTARHSNFICRSSARRVASRIGRILGLCVLLGSGISTAEPEGLPRLLENLKHTDFRVRTQAALALGASKDDKARKPLCAALEDPNVSVRAASAAALGRLGSGSEECLERRLATESDASAKAAIETSLEAIGGGEPTFTAQTRFYVAIGKVADKSGRSGGNVDRQVRVTMQKTGKGVDGFAVAPLYETPAKAKSRMAKHAGVRGFYLSPRVPPFEYTGGALTVRLEIAMFSYPDKAMIGNYSVRLTQPDVPAPDVTSENELVAMAAERAVEKFARIAPTL
ncbi:MAG TPA: HEAT repeat domain-containing protein [Polyangiaceae bacterium]|nr:HEAT repeat domain-containing protein [Polyangiaceae bacterium]